MNTADVLDAVVVACGLAMAGVGFWVLFLGRRGHPPKPATHGVRLWFTQLSAPTRLSIAVVLIALGYHLIVWCIPSSWGTPVGVPRAWWYWAVGFGAVWIGLSVWLDHLERRGQV